MQGHTVRLPGTVPGYQAHHLNQNAVYKSSIAPSAGESILLPGNAFTDEGSPHYEAHASLENWWDIDVDEELLNRCLVLTVNESREQTRAIHARQRQRQTLDGLLAANDRDALIKLHRNAQRLLIPRRRGHGVRDCGRRTVADQSVPDQPADWQLLEPRR